MSNENYYNYYVETLTNNLTDAILKNISLQSSLRLVEDSLKNREDNLSLLREELNNLRNQIESEKLEYNNVISHLTLENNELKSMRAQVESDRHQIQHIETFRRELMTCREENERLRNKLESLTSPTPKEKKNTTKTNAKEVINNDDSNVKVESSKDGGSF